MGERDCGRRVRRGHQRGRVLAGLAGTLLLLSTPTAGGASAPGGVRQTVRFVFSTTTTASPTGVQLTIDYVNPDDPSAKPPAVHTVVEALAVGAVIDTAVPARCTASDANLMVKGAKACPAGSVVGGGTLDLDSGVPGPVRIVHNKVILFNNRNELILLVEPAPAAGRVRAVARAPITDGRVFNAAAPPLPGGPPDGYTAIKHVQVELLPRVVTRAGVPHSYITTPPTCPASGSWSNIVTFTYRDGVTQVATSLSDCEPETGRAN